MQVIPAPAVPVTPATLPQDAAVKALPQNLGQAVAPISQRAIDPSRKSDRGGKNRSNGDRRKGGGAPDSRGERGGTLNIRV